MLTEIRVLAEASDIKQSGASILEGEQLFKASVRKGLILQIWLATSVTSTSDQLPACLSELLKEFAKVTEVPVGLPPFRGHEHNILLKDGVQLICERPYRYPYHQKFEIEKIVKEC